MCRASEAACGFPLNAQTQPKQLDARAARGLSGTTTAEIGGALSSVQQADERSPSKQLRQTCSQTGLLAKGTVCYDVVVAHNDRYGILPNRVNPQLRRKCQLRVTRCKSVYIRIRRA